MNEPAPESVSATTPLQIDMLEGLDLRSTREWHFSEQEIIKIGRSRDCDVCVNHPRVSRLHTLVLTDEDRWMITGVGANGTFVDGRRIEQHVLSRSGCTIQLCANGPILEVRPQTDDDEGAGDVTRWIGQLKDGNESAAEHLYECYFNRIVGLARKRLDGRTRRITDEEDVALVVLESLFRGLADGRYPELTSRDGLWRLLVVMTARRAINDVQAQHAQKRGHGQVRGESVFIRPDMDSPAGIDQFAVDAATPEFVEQLSGQLMDTLAELGDDSLKQTVMMKLEGFTNAEIAERLGVSERTVERKLSKLREHCQE